jgi:hypothetical protein
MEEQEKKWENENESEETPVSTPRLKPPTPERAAEIAAQMQEVQGLESLRDVFGKAAVVLVIVFLIGVFFFVQKTRWDSKMSVARHNFLYVFKRYQRLKDMGPGYPRPFEVNDNISLLAYAESETKGALSIFPNNVESRYLLYNIYALQLLVMEAEKRVYGSGFSTETVNNAMAGREKSLASLEKVDPGLVKSEKFKDKYIQMSKKDLNQALSKILNK